MREIVPGIFTWPWFSAKHGYDFNGYLILHPDGNLCVDPVEPDAEARALMSKVGVASILLTNRNHTRASASIREQTGASIAAHAADAEYARKQGVSVDGELRPGEKVGPFDIVPLPGKSPGEVALHWRERRILVVGDACVGRIPGELALLPDQVIDDVAQLQESLRRVAAEVDFETLLLGDGTSLLTGGRAALVRLVDSFR